jgi:hypothetical protein
MAKGILNIRNENLSDGQLNAFERRWNAMLRGEENAHRVPIMNAQQGIEYVNMQVGSDMQYREWMDFLIKVCCSAYSMDPSEINFNYGNIGQRSVLSEDSNRDKIVMSQERGLRPIQRHIAYALNLNFIWRHSEAFELEFVGLDSMTREEQADYNNKRVNTTCTLNEIRAEDDKPPLPGGDIVLNPMYFQSAQMAAQQAAQGAQGAAGGQAGSQGTDPNAASSQGDPGAAQGDPNQPDDDRYTLPGGRTVSRAQLLALQDEQNAQNDEEDNYRQAKSLTKGGAVRLDIVL